jgi:Planctomycete cytochrome C
MPVYPGAQRTHFSSRDRHAGVRGAARKSTAQSQFETSSLGLLAYERSQEGPCRRRFRATQPSRLSLALWPGPRPAPWAASRARLRYRASYYRGRQGRRPRTRVRPTVGRRPVQLPDARILSEHDAVMLYPMHMRSVALLFSSVLLASGQNGSPPAQAIFENHCVSCHGTAPMSGLDLRQRDTILRGGKRGPAVVPGKPEESLLYRAVMRQGDLQMPPGKQKLPPEDIARLR